MWTTGGGSVFYLTKEGAKVSAEWQSSNSLVVTVDKEFSKKDDSAFYCCDKVTVTYLGG
jgi:hypothetical protein